MSLDTCTVPGSPKENRIPPGMAELGLGLNGEAGVEQIVFNSARDAVAMMVAKLKASLENKPHVMLVNNLGGTSVIEMSVILYELTHSEINEQITHIIAPAAMMTSLDMQGFPISLYSADTREIKLLAKETVQTLLN